MPSEPTARPSGPTPGAPTPHSDYRSIMEWRTGKSNDRGRQAAESAARLRDDFPPGFMDHAGFDDLMANLVDLSPDQTARLIDGGRWPDRLPPRASEHGLEVLGSDAPKPWRMTRAPRSPASSQLRRAASPAHPTSYHCLLSSAVEDQGIRNRYNAERHRLKGHRDAVMFGLLYLLGLKPSTAVALVPGDFDPMRHTLTLRDVGGPDRKLPVPYTLVVQLEQLADLRPKHVTSLLPTFDPAMRSAGSGPTTAVIHETIRARWARSCSGMGEAPQPGDLRAALDTHLSTSAGVTSSGVDWMLGRRVRRSTPLSEAEAMAINEAIRVWDETVSSQT